MTVIFVIATILFFLIVDWLYRQRIEEQPNTIPVQTKGNISTVRAPEGIFFTKSHSWLNLIPSGKVYFGIDEFVGNIFKKPNPHFLKNSGEKIRKGDPILELKEGKNSIQIQAPISGEIVALNHDLIDHPEFFHTSAYNNGWIYNIKPDKISELKHFSLGSESVSWLQNELQRFRDFLLQFQANNKLVQATIQDGGVPVTGILTTIGADALTKFEQEFLQEK